MRILFVAFQSRARSNGGMESATRIFERFAAGHDWTFVTNRAGAFTDRWRAGGARVVVATFDEEAPLAQRSLALARWWGRIAAAGLGLRPDIVHANDIRACRLAAGTARLLGAPLVFTVRDTKADGEAYGAHWRRCLARSRAVVALSGGMADVLVRRAGADPGRLSVIPSIVDLAAFAPAAGPERAGLRRRLGLPPGAFAVGVVAALTEKKGQLGFIQRTLPALVERRPETQVHFIGDGGTGGYLARCRAAAERLGLGGHVAFHGHVTAVAEWYRALDCVAVASEREGLARCMIEAIACGTPVASFDVCSAAETLADTGAGLVVPAGDHAALADALAALAAEPADRAAMGARGRAVAEARFDGDRVAAAWLDLYAGVGAPIGATETPGRPCRRAMRPD